MQAVKSRCIKVIHFCIFICCYCTVIIKSCFSCIRRIRLIILIRNRIVFLQFLCSRKLCRKKFYLTYRNRHRFGIILAHFLPYIICFVCICCILSRYNTAICCFFLKIFLIQIHKMIIVRITNHIGCMLRNLDFHKITISCITSAASISFFKICIFFFKFRYRKRTCLYHVIRYLYCLIF